MSQTLIEAFLQLLRGTNQRAPVPRRVRLGSGLEQIEPRLLLSAAAPETALVGPPVPGDGGGFVDVGRVSADAGMALSWVVEIRASSTVDFDSSIQRIKPIASEPTLPLLPANSSAPGEGGFVPLEVEPPKLLQKAVPAIVPELAAPSMPSVAAADSPGVASVSLARVPTPPAQDLSEMDAAAAAVALQPARGQANAFQLASAVAPQSSFAIQRVAPPTPVSAPASAQPPRENVRWTSESLARAKTPDASGDAAVLLASAFEIATPMVLSSSVLASRGDDAILPSHVMSGQWPQSAAAEEAQAAAEGNHEDAPILAGAPTTLSSDAPNSQTALLVALAVLAWQAGSTYFLPASSRPGQTPLGQFP